MSRLITTRVLLALTLAAPLAGAQSTMPTTSDSAMATPAKGDPIPRPANDSLFRRARRMVSEGNGAAGRALVDSLLAATDPSTPGYGDALYWHGALAPTAAAAEADYRRVIVEYPLAYYSGDALLAIAELEQARGDRVGAMQHLQRFVREHPDNPGRGIAALGVARLAFEQRDSTLACAMLGAARRSMSPTDVELRNQVDYLGSRCASMPAPAAPVATPKETAKTPAPAPVRETAREAPATTRAAPAARTVTRYTVQVAAYNTRADADALVKRLAARGIKARVSGTSKPFRVRLALHATRKEASDELSAMRKRGIEGFVAEEEAGTGARTP